MRQDPTNADLLRASGAEVRELMRQAAAAGARLVHFTEGAICFPSKRSCRQLGPDEVGASDWTKADWAVLQAELDQIIALARELGIWTVIPSVHQLPEARPHNSMYVVSDQGKVVARYDERTLSTTKVTWMYTPGKEPVTFEVDGFRFGLALGLDVLFPELFMEYDGLGADGVLVSYATHRCLGARAHRGAGAWARREQHVLDQPRRAGQPGGRAGVGRESIRAVSGWRRPRGRYAGRRGGRTCTTPRTITDRSRLPSSDAGAHRSS